MNVAVFVSLCYGHILRRTLDAFRGNRCEPLFGPFKKLNATAAFLGLTFDIIKASQLMT